VDLFAAEVEILGEEEVDEKPTGQKGILKKKLVHLVSMVF
jgi:hypothetical protein